MDRNKRESVTSRILRVLNSTVCFVIAYLVLIYGFYWTMGIIANIFGFEATVYYYGIKFIVKSHKWSRVNVTAIFLSGPIFSLLYGFLCLYVYDKIFRRQTMLNMLLIWGFVLGACLFIAQFGIAALGHNEYNSPFYQNLTVVFAWWRIPAPLVYILQIAIAVLLVYFAVNYSKPILKTAFSFTKINKLSRKRRYYLETAIVPAILGAMILMAFTFPMNMYINAVYILYIMIFLAIGFFSLGYAEIGLDDINRYVFLQQFNVYIIVAMFLVMAIIRIIWLGFNLSF